MGQEIQGAHFRKQDFEAFARRLDAETALLAEWHQRGELSRRHGVGGFELEAWLVGADGMPLPINEEFLARMNDDGLVSPELSRFNIELNSTPLGLGGDALGRMHAELEGNWNRCRETAASLGAELMMIGSLPTVGAEQLVLENMSPMQRYRALNEQVLRLRGGRPLELSIHGEEVLESLHGDVMLEAATTSFQVHIQVDAARAVRYYNALQILSAPMVAISANSPLLFGKRLWAETRIPLFEQAVAVGGIANAAFGPLKRVSFGSGYARRSLQEVFEENRQHFPILLPVALAEEAAELSHLRLHNGTIWRWNRPLVGFDEDGTPHLRIEHRVVPAGPSIADTMANAALLFGLAHALAEADEAPEQHLEFARARDNFYQAARHGLDAHVHWLDGTQGRMRELLRRLLPLSREGLERMETAREAIDDYLGIIEARLEGGRTGSAWQLAWLERHGHDYAALVNAYRERQNSGLPVHDWSL